MSDTPLTKDQMLTQYNNYCRSCCPADAFDGFVEIAHQSMVVNGFYEKEVNVGEKIALMHSELSEALAAFNAGDPPDKHLPQFSSSAVEFADVILRIFDFCGSQKIPIVEALFEKMEYNITRPHKHGKKF